MLTKKFFNWLFRKSGEGLMYVGNSSFISAIVGVLIGMVLCMNSVLSQQTSVIIGICIFATPITLVLLAFILLPLIDLASSPVLLLRKIKNRMIQARRIKSEPLVMIDEKKICPFILPNGIEIIGLCPTTVICEALVCDQLGRDLDSTETVTVIENASIGDKVSLVLFRYRRYVPRGTNGSLQGKDDTSIHVVQLTLNKIGQCVQISYVSSYDVTTLAGVSDTKEFLGNIAGPYAELVAAVSHVQENFGSGSVSNRPRKTATTAQTT